MSMRSIVGSERATVRSKSTLLDGSRLPRPRRSLRGHLFVLLSRTVSHVRAQQIERPPTRAAGVAGR